MLAGASRRHRPVFSGVLSNFFFPKFSFSFGDLVGAYLSGEGCFLGGDFSFFLCLVRGRGILVTRLLTLLFHLGGRVTLVSGKKGHK